MDLAELMRAVKGARTYEELERLCGGSPSAQRLQKIATQKLKAFPDPPSIRGLARGLGVSESAIVLAAAESLDLSVLEPKSSLHALLPASVTKLTDDQVAAILQLIRAFSAGAEPVVGA